MNKQIDKWAGEFGRNYIGRNPASIKEMDEIYVKNFGFSRTSLNKEFLEGIPRDIKILEAGSSVGIQLGILREMGFKHLVGIDVSSEAVSKAKILTEGVDFLNASALDIPFKDNWFDLVFTSGVLIHQHPNNLGKAIDEIVRVSKKFIWGCEYFSKKPLEIVYRGNKGLLWKNDFLSVYLKRHPELRVVNERKFKYLDSDNVDCMFLLEKKR